MRNFTAAVLVLASGVLLMAQRKTQTQTVTGMVVEVNVSERRLVVSHDPVRGVMPAMIMSFDVRDDKQLRDLAPGSIVTFTLRAHSDAAYAEDLHVIQYQSAEQDPLTVRRLRLLRSARAAARLEVNQTVPDFSLTDQTHTPVALSQFRGKVV